MARLQGTVGAVLAALAIGAVGCGHPDSRSTGPPPPEAPQALPKLPPGWRGHRDRSVGYAIGLPPGWRLKTRGETLVRSPDHLVAVTLSVNRNADAFEIPVGEFATTALGALPGFEKPLEPSEPRRFRGTPLKAAQATATGTTKGTGISERATLVVLRHDAVVNYAAAILENAERRSAASDRALAVRMLRTLRDQPVQPAPPPESR